jgi:hypothetical protein
VGAFSNRVHDTKRPRGLGSLGSRDEVALVGRHTRPNDGFDALSLVGAALPSDSQGDTKDDGWPRSKGGRRHGKQRSVLPLSVGERPAEGEGDFGPDSGIFRPRRRRQAVLVPSFFLSS